MLLSLYAHALVKYTDVTNRLWRTLLSLPA